MAKRLALMFDGTWSTPENETNVARLREAIASADLRNVEQLIYYHSGVGTSWHGRLIGGAFGYGLSEIIKEGYAWLASNFEEGDEIFTLGFSRGAYTARSLVGLIRKCGVLRDADPAQVAQAYDIYRRRDASADSVEASTFRTRCSHTPRVHFIGVWDTVGSLGVPVTGLKLAPFRDYYNFHDTSLSKIVDFAYHALAIDECRADYAPTLWTETSPENRTIEQRWFIGAHCNVGGGYKDDTLYVSPLAWLQQRAASAGLSMKVNIVAKGEEWRTVPRDSFREFMFGLYRLFKKNSRFNRTIGRTAYESIDPSVWKRVQATDFENAYRPAPLDGITDGTLALKNSSRNMA